MSLRDPKVFIVIINWNGWQDTVECLSSVYALEYSNYEVVIVDNASTDDSVQQIMQWACGRPLRLLSNRENLGFSRGNNTGIQWALQEGADYILLLNNDTVVEKDFLNKLVALAEGHESIGAVWPKVLNPDGSIQVYPGEVPGGFLEVLQGTRFGHILTRLFGKTESPRTADYRFTTPSTVPNVATCCLLLKRTVFEAIGLLDENTFLLGEEVILAQQLKAAHFSTWMEPAAVIVHKGGNSQRKLRSARLWIEAIRSEIHYGRAYLHFNKFQVFVLKALRFISFVMKSCTSKDYRDHLRFFLKTYAFK